MSIDRAQHRPAHGDRDHRRAGRAAAAADATRAESAQHYPFTGWREFDPVTGQPTGVSAALVGVFARLAEIAIERLNQVPQKNLLAFLGPAGRGAAAAEPARVPVTFSLAAGSIVDAKVPAGTQVAAPGGGRRARCCSRPSGR